MVQQSFDKELLVEATEGLRDINPLDILDIWWTLPGNIMLTDGKNVGLATFEYPGMYTCHLYFKDKGRTAIRRGQKMLKYLFDNYDVKAIRGLIKVGFKPARWAVRQIGLKSLGIVSFPNGDDELFYATPDIFKDKEI